MAKNKVQTSRADREDLFMKARCEQQQTSTYREYIASGSQVELDVCMCQDVS